MNVTGNRQDISANSVPAMGPDGKLRSVRKRREIAQSATHEVYFLYGCNRIKIGTSRYPLRRVLMDIVPYCPSPLQIIGTIPGGPVVEGALHKRFEAASLRDEWFDLTPELRGFLCEDRHRAERLIGAENYYREWLREEIAYQERQNANSDH